MTKNYLGHHLAVTFEASCRLPWRKIADCSATSRGIRFLSVSCLKRHHPTLTASHRKKNFHNQLPPQHNIDNAQRRDYLKLVYAKFENLRVADYPGWICGVIAIVCLIFLLLYIFLTPLRAHP